MQTQVECVGPDMDIFSLAQQFIGDHRRRYPVLEIGQLVGQISPPDLLRAALDVSSLTTPATEWRSHRRERIQSHAVGIRACDE